MTAACSARSANGSRTRRQGRGLLATVPSRPRARNGPREKRTDAATWRQPGKPGITPSVARALQKAPQSVDRPLLF
eukprot:5568515-Lingulodinium_polyedra.AAC.1